MASRLGRRGAATLLAMALVLSGIAAGQSAVQSAGHAQAPPSTTTDLPSANPLSHLRSMIARGQAAEALSQLDSLAAQKPVSAGVQRLRGLALYSLNRLPQAEAAFEAELKEASVNHQQDRESDQLLGLTLYQLGRPADAIPYLEAAHAASSNEKAGHEKSANAVSTNDKANPSFVLALCYMDTRRYDDARHAFAQQYGFPPDSAAAYLLAARMLFRREYTPIAEEFARKALALDPAMPLAHQLLGEAALAGEHLDEALREFQLELELNPLDGAVYDRLGDAYLRAAKYQLAQDSLQQALLLEPDSTGPYILLGKVLLRRNDPAGALTYLERADQMDAANYRTHSLLSQAFRALGRSADAARETQTSQRLQAASEPKLTPSSSPAPIPGATPNP